MLWLAELQFRLTEGRDAPERVERVGRSPLAWPGPDLDRAFRSGRTDCLAPSQPDSLLASTRRRRSIEPETHLYCREAMVNDQ